MVIVLIRLGFHWALSVINIKKHRLEYYDSIMYEGCKNEVLSRLKNYVVEEFKDKKKVKNYNVSEWVYYTVENLPQQTNKYDCVVFAMTFAEQHQQRCISLISAFRSTKAHEIFSYENDVGDNKCKIIAY